MIDNSKLADKCQAVARCLTYNDDKDQAAAKHLLLECAHRLNSSCVRVHKKSDGLLVINATGKARYMTWRERITYRFFAVVPRP